MINAYADIPPPFTGYPVYRGLVPFRGINLPWGQVYLWAPTEAEPEGAIITRYHGGDQSVFVPPIHDLDFREAAREMGYGSHAALYGAQHELTHHWLAWAIGLPTSRVIYADAYGTRALCDADDASGRIPWPFTCADEEHLVNRMQAFVRLGKLDDYGCLRGLWGNRLGKAAQHLYGFWYPWMRPPGSYMPPRPHISCEATGLPLFLDSPHGPAKG